MADSRGPIAGPDQFIYVDMVATIAIPVPEGVPIRDFLSSPTYEDELLHALSGMTLDDFDVRAVRDANTDKDIWAN